MRGANKYVDIEVEVDEDEDEDEEEAGEAGFEVAGEWRQRASATSLCQAAVWLHEASSEATISLCRAIRSRLQDRDISCGQKGHLLT